jgi:predicted acetyltransferase
VGLAAARQILTRWPGAWEIAVTRRNTAALPFWRQAARACASGAGPEEVDLSGPEWDGPVIRLVSGAGAG